MPLLLTEADVRGLISMHDLVPLMREALAAFSSGHVVQPVRLGLQLGARPAIFGVMPAYMAAPPALGAKLVTVFKENVARGLPTHLATIVLLSPDTGELLAVMDGRYITEARTAAASAVSVDLLARSDASTLAILGSGVQARSHLEALPLVRPVAHVRVWSPTPSHLAQFVADAASLSPARVEAAPSAEAAVRGADVIVLAVSSTTPALADRWVRSGAHVVSLGGIRPNQREMDPALVVRARLFVDSRAAALAESGDVLLGIQEGLFTERHVRGELGDLVRGSIAGRTSDADVTLFKSLGLAVEDVAAAELAYRRARERGVGAEVPC
jgi:ornithine cyclodeaminase/alanine dehydrogenase-like protein (mu-crystallin family)